MNLPLEKQVDEFWRSYEAHRSTVVVMPEAINKEWKSRHLKMLQDAEARGVERACQHVETRFQDKETANIIRNELT